jgi:hypothetical protein
MDFVVMGRNDVEPVVQLTARSERQVERRLGLQM